MKTIELKSGPRLNACPRCRASVLTIETTAEGTVWFTARISCGYCGNVGPSARCSDAPAALKSASREWNESVD